MAFLPEKDEIIFSFNLFELQYVASVSDIF